MNPMIINPGTPAPSKMDRLAEQASAASARIRPAQLMQKSQGISAPGGQALQAAQTSAIGNALGEPGKIRAENRAHDRVLEMGELGHQRDKEMADIAHRRKIARDDEVDRREWERTGRETHELRKEESKQRSATSKGQMEMYAQNAKLARENHHNTILLNIQKLRDAKRSGNIEAAKGKAADEILAHIDPMVKTGAADLHSRVHTLYVTEAQDNDASAETLEAAIAAADVGEGYASDPAQVQLVGQWLVSNGNSLMANNLVEAWDERLKDLLGQKTDILKMKGLTKEQAEAQGGELDSIIARLGESIGYDPQIEPSVRSLPPSDDSETGDTGTGVGEKDSAFGTWSLSNPKLEGESDAAYFNRYKMSLGGGEAPSDESEGGLRINPNRKQGEKLIEGDAESLIGGIGQAGVNAAAKGKDAFDNAGGVSGIAEDVGDAVVENPTTAALAAYGGYHGIKYLGEARTFDDFLKAGGYASGEFGDKMNKRLKSMGLKEFATPYPTLGPEGQVGRTKKMAAAKAKWDADLKAHFNSEVGDHKMRRIQTLFSKFPKLKGRLPKDSKLLKFLKGGLYLTGIAQAADTWKDIKSLMNGAPEEEKQALAETAADLQKIEAVQEESRKDEVAIAQATKAAGQRILNDANATDNNATAPVENNATHTMSDGSVMQGATHTPGAAVIRPPAKMSEHDARMKRLGPLPASAFHSDPDVEAQMAREPGSVRPATVTKDKIIMVNRAMQMMGQSDLNMSLEDVLRAQHRFGSISETDLMWMLKNQDVFGHPK